MQNRRPISLKRALVGAALAGAVGTIAGCAYNEQLGRQQVLLIDDQALQTASLQAWRQTLATQRRSTDPELNRRVREVGSRIVQAAGLGNRNWEYVVFDNAQANAFVLPGGQIGVYSGLFKNTQNDDQLAAVIGHEVAHVVARHSAERYSQTALAQAGLGVAQSAAGGGRAAQAVSALGGIGAQVGVLLPFSRQHELEADRLGVDFMARAGYRPAEALTLWRNMSAGRTGGSTPQWASTHPNDATRLAQLEAYLRGKGML